MTSHSQGLVDITIYQEVLSDEKKKASGTSWASCIETEQVLQIPTRI